MYQRYGEMIEIDGTYKTNLISMPLYTILCEDNYELGQPVAFYFVRDEKRSNIDAGLEIFSQVSFWFM